MTKEEILAMEAGKELNKLIGEEIFELEVKDFWPVEPKPNGYSYHMRVSAEGSGYRQAWDLLPHYSTDISAAWPVVEKLKDYYPKIEFNQYSRKWEVEFLLCAIALADTAPEAICKAALLTKLEAT